MKKLIIAALLFISISSFAQENPVYRKFVPIETKDMDNFFMALENWKRLVIYDPKSTPESKIKTSQDLDAYILDLAYRIKLDSVRIDSAKVIAKPKKK